MRATLSSTFLVRAGPVRFEEPTTAMKSEPALPVRWGVQGFQRLDLGQPKVGPRDHLQPADGLLQQAQFVHAALTDKGGRDPDAV